MNHSEQFKRSVNIWKITDGEYIDMYVEMYIWLENKLNNLNSYTFNNIPLSTYYGISNDNLLYGVDKEADIIWVDTNNLLQVFRDKFVIGSISIIWEYLKILHIYFTTYKNINCSETFNRTL